MCEQTNDTTSIYNTKGTDVCRKDLSKYMLKRCRYGVTECYTQVLNRHKFRRGCFERSDQVAVDCEENLREDCRVCDFDSCNNRPIEIPGFISCVQCTTGCDEVIEPTPCIDVTQLMTDESKCYFIFDAAGKVTEKGCLTKDTDAKITKDQILLTCNEVGCNYAAPKGDFHCYKGVETNDTECETDKVSEFPGCYLLYKGRRVISYKRFPKHLPIFQIWIIWQSLDATLT